MATSDAVEQHLVALEQRFTDEWEQFLPCSRSFTVVRDVEILQDGSVEGHPAALLRSLPHATNLQVHLREVLFGLFSIGMPEIQTSPPERSLKTRDGASVVLPLTVAILSKQRSAMFRGTTAQISGLAGAACGGAVGSEAFGGCLGLGGRSTLFIGPLGWSVSFRAGRAFFETGMSGAALLEARAVNDISDESLSSVVDSPSGSLPVGAATAGIGPGCICWNRAVALAFFRWVLTSASPTRLQHD